MKTNTDVRTVYLLRRMIEEFTLHKNDLRIETEQIGSLLKVKLRCNQEDMPRILGKSAKNLRALQVIVKAIGVAYGQNVEVELIGPDKGSTQNHAPFIAREEWPQEQIALLLGDVANELFRFAEVETSERETTSVFDVHVDLAQSLGRVKLLGDALHTIFKAVGKAKGRLVTVNLIRDSEAERQPHAADGRFAGSD